jgi:histone H3/H4
MVSDTKEELAAERDRVQREVRSATDQALQEIMHKAANLAVDVARKALREQLTPDVQAAIQRRAVEELKAQTGSFSAN